MSDTKKENLFAKLAQQNARAVSEDAASAAGSLVEDTPPSPPLPDGPKPKQPIARKKTEPTKGKRVNPDYCQANAYVPKTLRRAVDKALFDLPEMDYSTLVADLLRKWLKSRGVSE